ncbi:MAG: hypothetical protein H6737_09935 [Alphaproteobacteria bacterium]|nr:hypothetical protein [Alphaproteobacteria bacterium]
MRAVRPLLVLSALGLGLTGVVSCEKYEAPQPVPFHSGFDWGPAHGPSLEQIQYDASIDTDPQFDANNFCDKCHVGGASQQVADGVYNLNGDPVLVADPASGWATVLSPLCQDCHPLRVGLVEPIECPPGAQSEYCRFQAQGAHANVNPVNGCDGAACHSIYPPTTWSIGGENGGGHDDPPLSEIFPLEGGHAGRACGDCHAGDYTAEAGKAEYCGNCHTRAGEGEDATHYPPDRDGWTDERERDCKACHSSFAEGQSRYILEMPANWGANNEHYFRTPHHTVQDWDTFPAVVANGVNDWKNGCDDCHDVGFATGTGGTYLSTTDNRFSCGKCHDLPQLELDYPAYHDNLAANPAGCTQTNCHPSGTIQGPNEPN